uniref:Uncharacterized protein n=1 Tax=Lygus hesperus TaxID=30085 RepID=A0A0K8S973_LYGHE
MSLSSAVCSEVVSTSNWKTWHLQNCFMGWRSIPNASSSICNTTALAPNKNSSKGGGGPPCWSTCAQCSAIELASDPWPVQKKLVREPGFEPLTYVSHHMSCLWLKIVGAQKLPVRHHSAYN